MEYGGDDRRRQFSAECATDSSNLRDLLLIKDEDNSVPNNSPEIRTLGSGVTAGKSSDQLPTTNRTLLDIIRDDPNVSRESKKSWKSFKDKIRLRRAGAAWTSTITIPASDVPITTNVSRVITRRQSSRFPTMDVSNSDESTQLNEQAGVPQMNSIPSNRAMLLRRNTSRIPERQNSRLIRSEFNASEMFEQRSQSPEGGEAAEREHEEPEAEEEAVEDDEEEKAETTGQDPPVRMSLMALLAETDRQMGIDGSAYTMEDGDEEEEEEEESGGGGGEYNNCCVCLVRHKGAAFIPCGHTFCRLCSRELWVQRGNCPVCNNFILEILDIF